MTNRKGSILTGEALKDEIEQYKGLTIHGNRIRISFTYKGQRCIENIDDQLTAKNIKAADDKRTAIRHEISRGSFKYEEHFPNSKKTHLFSCKPRTEETLSAVLNRWLEIKKTKLAPSSYKSYHNKSHCHIIPKFGSRKISTILQSEINEWVSKDLHHLSNKTINNILLVLRGCFADAVKDQKLDSSPMEHVDPLKQLENEPDPFSLEEIRAFVNTPTNRVQEVNAFEFSCLTGLRPSEMIALAWEDIDTVNWTLKIDRARVNNSFKRTKTKSSKRIINLIAPAIDVLKRQMEFSKNLPTQKVKVLAEDNKTVETDNVRLVFLNSLTNEPHSDVSNYRSRFFMNHLAKAGIRVRPPKQARHTFASQLLTKGVNIKWIANQMGHKSIKMIEQHYGKYMPNEMPDMAMQVSNMLGYDSKRSNADPRFEEIELNPLD